MKSIIYLNIKCEHVVVYPPKVFWGVIDVLFYYYLVWDRYAGEGCSIAPGSRPGSVLVILNCSTYHVLQIAFSTECTV